MTKSYTLSFQLYSAREFPPLADQLETLAQIGYTAIEPYSDIYEHDAAALRRLADACGLAMPSVLTTLDLMNERADEAIEMAKILGAETIVIPYIFPDKRPVDLDGWNRVAERVAGHAVKATAAGLVLAWHNHDFEYVRLEDGLRPIDHLLAGEGVNWEPDIGWLQRAGCALDEEFGRYGSKVKLVHIKDTAPAGTTAEGGWTELGAGTLDWETAWKVIKATDARLLVAEHDDPADWSRFARQAYSFMKSATLSGAGQ